MNIGVNIVEDDFGTAWFKLLRAIWDEGSPVSPRGFETRELINTHITVNNMARNILVHPARGLSYRFMVAEWLWIAAGLNDVATITRWNKNIAQFSDNGASFAGAYGVRIAPQVPWILEQLRKPGSRQAVVSIWTPAPAPSRDIPCTLTWQMLARDGGLHAVVNMRSSDIFWGLAYDFFNFSQLTAGVAGELGLSRGSLSFNLGSSHMYERDREKLGAILVDPDTLRTVVSPPLPGLPPAGRILALEESLAVPWDAYAAALAAPTSTAALQALREAAAAETTPG